MPLVELVGPPAVGKTTLVAACVARGARDARRAVLRPRSSLVAPLVDRARGVHQRTGVRRALADRLLREPGLGQVEAALTAVAPTWTQFLDLVLEGPPPALDPSPARRALALMERTWLHEAIGLRALLAIRSDAGDGIPPLLLDEGLTHPYKARAAAGDDPARLARYVAQVPLPDVLVVLDADPELVAARVRARHAAEPGRVRWTSLGEPVDDGTLRAELERVRDEVRAVEHAARARGCNVVGLNVTDDPVDALAARLSDELIAVRRRAEQDATA